MLEITPAIMFFLFSHHCVKIPYKASRGDEILFNPCLSKVLVHLCGKARQSVFFYYSAGSLWPQVFHLALGQETEEESPET